MIARSQVYADATTNRESFTVPVDTDPHRVRLQAVGTTISARVWDATDPEPSTWDATTTDSGFANGFVALTDEQVGTANVSVSLDDFTGGDPTTPLGPVATYSYDADGRPTQADLTGRGDGG